MKRLLTGLIWPILAGAGAVAFASNGGWPAHIYFGFVVAAMTLNWQIDNELRLITESRVAILEKRVDKLREDV